MEEHAIVDSSFSAIINAPLAPAGDFRRDSSLFLDCVRNPEAQNRIKAAMKRGFQTREAEMALARILGDLAATFNNKAELG